MALSDLIIGAESGGDPNAMNPRSSASGAGQFIDSTWLDTIQKHRPDLLEGRSPQEILALRSDPTLSKEMTDAYAQDNGDKLASAGLPVTPGTQYLAHFAGPGGAVKVLQADPNAPVGAVLGAGAVSANPFMRNMTVGDLRAWADRKMGAQPAPGAAPAVVAAPQPSAPAGMPAFAWSPQGQQQAPAQQQPSAFGALGAMASRFGSGGGAPAAAPAQDSLPVPQMAAPMLGGQMQRRPLDLSKLQAIAQGPDLSGLFFRG